jgi:hypothetical protein
LTRGTRSKRRQEESDEETENRDEQDEDEDKSTFKSENIAGDTATDDEEVDTEEVKTEVKEGTKAETDENIEAKTEPKVEVVDQEPKTEADATVTPSTGPKVVPENQQYLDEIKCWRCICTTLEDWSAVCEKYKASKKKPDQELAELIEEQYLPEMPALFAKAVSLNLINLIGFNSRLLTFPIFEGKRESSQTAATPTETNVTTFNEQNAKFFQYCKLC